MQRTDHPNTARLDLLDPVEVSKLGWSGDRHRGSGRGLPQWSPPLSPPRIFGRVRRTPDVPAGRRAPLCRLEDPGPQRSALREAVRGGNQSTGHDRVRHQPDMAWSGSPGTVLPKLAYAQRLIAALSLVLIRQRDATGLITFDDDVRTVTPPRARLSHWRQLLQVLGATRLDSGTAAEPALRRVIGAAAPPGSGGICLGSIAGPGSRTQGASLSPASRPPGSGSPYHGPRRGEPRRE